MRRFQPFFLLAAVLGCIKPAPLAVAARQELDSFAKSIGDYRQQKGQWPMNLVTAVGQTCLGVHPGCVSSGGKRQDPWGTPYEYDQSLRSVLVRSAGPDRILGSKDDLEISVPAPLPAKP